MRIKSLFTAILGIGVAGGAVFFAQERLDEQKRAAEEKSVVRVIAAAQEIPFGSVIERQMLTTIAWPVESVPKGVFTDMDEIVAKTGEPPRRAKRPLSQGELLITSKVSGFGEKVTIVQTLGDNTRAMAIKVDAGSGVGGFVTPGDFVDIVLTQGRGQNLTAVTILQNIRVIGVDQKADEQLDQPGIARTVTVEVTAHQGQRLALAQQAGNLSLSLRSLETAEDKPLEAIRLNDILVKTATEEDEEDRSVVRVRRGTGDVEEEVVN